jgi:two-component sensor histidine kinase
MKVDVGDIQMGIDRAIPYGLIINELVSNAIKHAFPDGRRGEIAISLRADDRGGLTLTVADNGVGLPPGLDFRNTETLGLQLVNLLTKQLKGELSVLDDGGAAFIIRFKS